MVVCVYVFVYVYASVLAIYACMYVCEAIVGFNKCTHFVILTMYSLCIAIIRYYMVRCYCRYQFESGFWPNILLAYFLDTFWQHLPESVAIQTKKV